MKSQMANRKSQLRNAFTLIELLLVLVILAVLAAVVVPKFTHRSEEAKVAAAKPRQKEEVVLRYFDEHLVVVEKPCGISTVRHPLERSWSARRKDLSPTLEDIVPRLIAQQEGRHRKGPLPRLRIVQRLDKKSPSFKVPTSFLRQSL